MNKDDADDDDDDGCDDYDNKKSLILISKLKMWYTTYNFYY